MGTEKRERQKANRQTRLETERQQEKRDNLKQRLIVGGAVGGAIIVFLLAVSVFSDDGETEIDASSDTTAVADTDCPPEDASGERIVQWTAAPEMCIDPALAYTAELSTSAGDITIELDAATAPATVNNFVFLARNRYYEGVPFHRIIPGFMIQGGDAVGEPLGTGGPGYTFADELPEDGLYKIGSVAMANSGPDTNGSQFFIVTGDSGVALPPDYSLFGHVIEGMDVVEAIEATGTSGGTPSFETLIESVTITES